MLRPWVEVSDFHLHCLHLEVLRWDGADLVGDLIPFHGDVLPLDVGDVNEDVLLPVGGLDEAVSPGSGEVFADASVRRPRDGSGSGGVGARALGGQRAGQIGQSLGGALLPHAAALPREREGEGE